MSKEQGITRGKWIGVRQLYDVIEIKAESGKLVAVLGYNLSFPELNKGDDRSVWEATADADFICLCANQCQSINPSHPEYVAEGIGEMVKALKMINTAYDKGSNMVDLYEPMEQVLKTIKDIERKK